MTSSSQFPPLHVAALYDGFTSSVYAHQAIESLAMALLPVSPIEPFMWSFAGLVSPDIRSASLLNASETDVIVVSASGTAPLPNHVKSWFSICFQECAPKRPLIVAIHQYDLDTPDTTLPLCLDLAEIASQWQTQVLCNNEFDARLDDGLAGELTHLNAPNRSFISFAFPHQNRNAPLSLAPAG